MTWSRDRDGSAIHRIDMPSGQAGFPDPPCPVQLKFLPVPQSGGWVLLANVRPGETGAIAAWLAGQAAYAGITVAPGIAPRLVRARAASLPPLWSEVAALVSVHHLDLRSQSASWFVEGARTDIAALLQRLCASGPSQDDVPVRCRSVHLPGRPAEITRRQHEALCAAVALGYYEIPHRIDLRTLARHTGVSLGSFSELLRRAESAVLRHHVDSRLLAWSGPEESAWEPAADRGAIGPAGQFISSEPSLPSSRSPERNVSYSGVASSDSPTAPWNRV